MVHGSAFIYDRSCFSGGARRPINQLVNGVSTRVALKPEDVRYQFGGTIGGPIVKDKAFFFFSYDEQKRNFPGVAVFSTPGYLNTVNRTTLMARGLTTAQIDSTLNFINSMTGHRVVAIRLFLPKWLEHQLSSHVHCSIKPLRWKS
jgi:hypothetical protein